MFKDNLKKYRELANLTKAEMARRLKMKYTTYDNYERGQSDPKINILIKIADILDISVDRLVGRNDKLENEHTKKLISKLLDVDEEYKDSFIAKDEKYFELKLKDIQDNNIYFETKINDRIVYFEYPKQLFEEGYKRIRHENFLLDKYRTRKFLLYYCLKQLYGNLFNKIRNQPYKTKKEQESFFNEVDVIGDLLIKYKIDEEEKFFQL